MVDELLRLFHVDAGLFQLIFGVLCVHCPKSGYHFEGAGFHLLLGPQLCGELGYCQLTNILQKRAQFRPDCAYFLVSVGQTRPRLSLVGHVASTGQGLCHGFSPGFELQLPKQIAKCTRTCVVCV